MSSFIYFIDKLLRIFTIKFFLNLSRRNSFCTFKINYFALIFKEVKLAFPVITYGTYDLLHYGHIELLRRAREMGDYLIVALSSDEFNRIKNKKSYYNYEQRKMMLESIRYVDLVIPEEDWGQKERDVEPRFINLSPLFSFTV